MIEQDDDDAVPEFDALALMAEARAAGLSAEKAEAEFVKLARAFVKLETGRKLLRAMIQRYNFFGSVFSAEDGMNPGTAAHRDGMRAVLSDILNSAYKK